MVKQYAIIHDTGKEFLITGTTQEGALEIHPNDMYREIDAELADTINEKLKDSRITLKKVTDPNRLVLDDLKITTIGGLLIAQEKAFSRARDEMSNRLDHSVLFDFFEILNLNNLFMHKGYNIIKEQEDTFFEIISGEDEDLKEKLEKYLTAYDRLSKHKSLHEKFCEFEDNIQRSQNEREVDKYLNTFLSLFR